MRTIFLMLARNCWSNNSWRRPPKNGATLNPAARISSDDRACHRILHTLTASLIPYGRQDIDQEDIDAVVSVLRSEFLTQGPTVSQFEKVSIQYHRWSLIRTRFQLHRVLEGIEAEPGPVLSTVIDKALRNDLETTCLRRVRSSR